MAGWWRLCMRWRESWQFQGKLPFSHVPSLSLTFSRRTEYQRRLLLTVPHQEVIHLPVEVVCHCPFVLDVKADGDPFQLDRTELIPELRPVSAAPHA